MTTIVALVLFRGRAILDQPGLPARTLTLGKWGYAVNTFALIFAFGTQRAVLRLRIASYQLNLSHSDIDFLLLPPGHTGYERQHYELCCRASTLSLYKIDPILMVRTCVGRPGHRPDPCCCHLAGRWSPTLCWSAKFG